MCFAPPSPGERLVLFTKSLVAKHMKSVVPYPEKWWQYFCLLTFISEEHETRPGISRYLRGDVCNRVRIDNSAAEKPPGSHCSRREAGGGWPSLRVPVQRVL